MSKETTSHFTKVTYSTNIIYKVTKTSQHHNISPKSMKTVGAEPSKHSHSKGKTFQTKCTLFWNVWLFFQRCTVELRPATCWPLPVSWLIWVLVSFSTRSPSLATSLRTHMKGLTSLMRLDSSSSSSLSAVWLMQVKTYASGSPRPLNRASFLAFLQTICNEGRETTFRLRAKLFDNEKS